MAEDVGSPERNRSLNDMQTYYERKKKDVREKGEAEVQQIQQSYKEKAKAATESGEAAVNHINENKRRQIDQVAGQTNSNLEHMRENQKERVDGERKAEEVQDTSLNKAREKHREVVGHQRALMSEDEMNLRQEATEKEEHIKKTYAEELDGGRQRLDKLKHSQTEQLVKLRGENDDRLGQEMDIGREQVKAIKAKTTRAVDGERTQSRENIDRVRTQNEMAVKNEVQRGEQQRESVRQMQTKNMQNVEDRGTKSFDEQKKRQTDLLQKQTLVYDKQQEKMKADHATRLTLLDQTENTDYAKRADEYSNRKEKQLGDFQAQYGHNSEANIQTLHDQKQNLIRAMDGQKSELYQKVKRYTDMKNDPFYRILDMDSKLSQTDKAYIFSTRIAPEEKDAIDVRVQKDKIVVTGQRSFQDSLADADKTIKTSNYQTVHQEHKLEHPVRESEVARFYRDGVLTVIVPKA